jgi:hypothetical protein
MEFRLVYERILPARSGSNAYLREGEKDYFFCLLEDDLLITEFTVTSDRLLAPLRSGDGPNDVYLVMKVKTKIANHCKAYLEFLS